MVSYTGMARALREQSPVANIRFDELTQKSIDVRAKRPVGGVYGSTRVSRQRNPYGYVVEEEIVEVKVTHLNSFSTAFQLTEKQTPTFTFNCFRTTRCPRARRPWLQWIQAGLSQKTKS